MNAEDKKLIKEITARLPAMELIGDEDDGFATAEEIRELLADIERYLGSANARV